MLSSYAIKNMEDARPLLARMQARAHGAGADTDTTVEQYVRGILQNVREKGDEALYSYTREFDCKELNGPLRLTDMDLQLAAASVPTDDMEIIADCATRIRTFHEAQKKQSWFNTHPSGTIVGQMLLPVDRAGLYIPGGRGGNTPLLSSLLMGAIPAQVAGVKEIALLSPPREDGTLSPHILAAAYLLDINEVYRVGGPWGIGALAYGTASIPPVDVIAGPGNVYVAEAKKQVQGQVGIDMMAGPSEIVILADDTAALDYIAADMLSQAEHDPLASAICITDSQRIAERLPEILAEKLASLPRADIAHSSLVNFGAVVHCASMQLALNLVNALAPEHLEVCTRDPWGILPGIRHAGAIFLGSFSVESLGDYYAGPNHVLPTAGTARFSSALGVETFTKKSSIIAASAPYTREAISSVARFARLEGLEAHARAIEARK